MKKAMIAKEEKGARRVGKAEDANNAGTAGRVLEVGKADDASQAEDANQAGAAGRLLEAGKAEDANNAGTAGRVLEARSVLKAGRLLKGRKVLKSAMACLLAIVLAFGGAFPAAVESVYAAPGFLQLETITPSFAQVGYDSYRVNIGPEGNPLRLMRDGVLTTFTNGIGVHASSEVIFNIDGFGATRFTTLYGVNYRTNTNDGRIRFSIYVDDVCLLDGGVIGAGYLTDRNDCGEADLVIPTGAKTLRLVATGVVPGSNPISNCHSVWVEPKLYLEDMNRRLVKLSAPSSLEVGLSSQAKALFTSLTGEIVDVDVSEQNFASSNDAVATVNSSGLITGVAQGSAVISYSAVADGISYSASTEIAVVGYEKTWSLVSPGENSEIRAMMDDNGAVFYYALQNGERVIETSSLGFITSLGNFSSGLTYVGEEDALMYESSTTLSGAASVYTNRAREKTLEFTKGDMKFDVVFRAYDDGVAYRYIISNADGGSSAITLTDETSTFTVPANSTVTYQPNPSGSTACHEGTFSMGPSGGFSGKQTIPLLYETPTGSFVLINEAALTGAYCGSVLEATAGSGVLKVGQPQQQTTSPVSVTPFASPWRYAVTGSLANTIESSMAENLNPAADYATYKYDEWVVPGVVSWLWLVGGYGIQSNQAELRNYIDLAVEMGWKHIILDEGWQSAGRGNYDGRYPANFKENVIDYGKSKGIGIFLWVHVSDIDTPTKIDTWLTQWKNDGISGIKADFFDRESQDRMQLYDYLYQKTAELRLLLLCHGTNKPTGEIRTYPHLLGKEGVRGEESNNVLKDQTVRMAYTRAAVGPTDFTPRIYPGGSSNTTTSHQLAINLVYESGMPVMASSAADYRRSPAYPILRNLPARWDETVFLSGRPDTYAALARRNGDNWFVSAINGSGQRSIDVSLDFLQNGVEYTATIYRDVLGGGRNDMEVESFAVTKGDIVNITMLDGGGFAMKITAPYAIRSIDLNSPPELIYVGDTFQFLATVDPFDYEPGDTVWSSSNPEVAAVSSGGLVTAKTPGRAIITLASKNEPSVRCERLVKVAYNSSSEYLPADGWQIQRQTENLEFNSATSLSITTSIGNFGGSDTANNIMYRTPSDANFDISVKVTGIPGMNFQSYMIFARAAANHNRFVGAIRRYHTFLSVGGNNNILQLYSQGASPAEQQVADAGAAAAGDGAGGGAGDGGGDGASGDDDTDCWLRLVKNGNTFTAYYKYDESDAWTQYAVSTNNNFSGLEAGDLEIGVMATNSQGDGTQDNPRTATFEDFTYSSDTTPTVIIPFAADKAFYVPEGSWKTDRKNDSLVYNSATSLSITTSLGDFGGGDSASNILYRTPTDADFDVSVTLTGVPAMNYQSFMLFARAANNHNRFVGTIRRHHTNLAIGGNNQIFQLFSYDTQNREQQVADGGYSTNQTCYLRLVKSGTDFTGFYKYNEADAWTQIGGVRANSTFAGLSAGELEIGIMATNSQTNGTPDTPVTATFENFTYAGAIIPFAENKPNYVADIDTIGKTVAIETPFSALGLPSEIPVFTAFGDTILYPVVWDSSAYDQTQVGEYAVEGVINDSGKIPNTIGLKAIAAITVLDEFQATPISVTATPGAISAVTRIENYQASPQSCFVILAVYDKTLRLVGADMQPVTVISGETAEVTCEIDGVANGEGYTVKIMAWDEKYAPIVEAYTSIL